MQTLLKRFNEKEITGSTIRNYQKSIKLYLDVADIQIAWKKISRGLPRARNYSDDRIPAIEEIRTLLSYPDRRVKGLIYTMSSSEIRWTEYGVNSVFRLLQGTVAIIFGLAIAKNILVNRWIGVGGVIVGILTIVAGIEVSYSAFAYPNFEGIRGISMIILLACVVILGDAMLKRTSTKRI